MLESEADVEESLCRKERSISQLKALNIPTIEHLPRKHALCMSRRRSHEVIVQRILALSHVSVRGQYDDPEFDAKLMERLGGTPDYSPREFSFLAGETPSEKAVMSWRFEALNVLLWSLEFISDLGPETETCSQKKMANIVTSHCSEGLLEHGRLRRQGVILDALDRAYRLHWAVAEAALRQTKMPEGLNASVVYERRYALEWLAGEGYAWDEIPMDT
jgi:hypothetical protein